MKKLIDKLEKECLIGLKDAGYGGWQTGFRDAIDIVRAHNPWHEVTELPPEWEQYRKQSINVLVLSEDGKVEISYYHFGFKSWGATFTPIKWAYLPEAKP